MQQLPIVLFAYNRPDHTRRTLEALSRNRLASTASLTIFCDGPADSATSEERRRIDEVRGIARSRTWCGETIVHERESNLGLARSIRGGVTEMLDRHEHVIVLEDDIETSPGFLQYMRDSLSLYETDNRVMHIGAYVPNTSYRSLVPNTFLSHHMTCWGWGTWRRAWKHARWDAVELLREIDASTGGRRRFDLDGCVPSSPQLEANITGRLNTWAIFWAASIYLADGLCLLPRQAVVRNIGTDGSGVHFTGTTHIYDVEPADSVRVTKVPIRESRRGAFYLRSFYRHGQNSGVRTRARHAARRIRSGIGHRLRALKAITKDGDA